MTLIDLQKVLGKQIEGMVSGEADSEQARAVASLAKQMINNADIILRADKFTKTDGHRIDYVVGQVNEN